MSSVFSKIVSGQLPSHKVYEDSSTLAFLDIHPVQTGHCLVIPKKEVEFIWDLDDQTYQAVMTTVKKVGWRLRMVLAKPYVGIKVVGLDVPHAHVQLIPFSSASEFNASQDMNQETDQQMLAQLAKKLYFH